MRGRRKLASLALEEGAVYYWELISNFGKSQRNKLAVKATHNLESQEKLHIDRGNLGNSCLELGEKGEEGIVHHLEYIHQHFYLKILYNKEY